MFQKNLQAVMDILNQSLTPAKGLRTCPMFDDRLSLTDEFDEWLNEMAKHILASTGTRETKDSLEGAATALELLTANLLKASDISNEGWLSISLRSNDYRR